MYGGYKGREEGVGSLANFQTNPIIQLSVLYDVKLILFHAYFVKPPNVFTALNAIYTVISSARPLIVHGHEFKVL